ncbi:MAG: hypothetical protein M1829_002071 [Trizodia sp. TS-e1964]|nr:MAG: hypothetical protein M1829_002071 [Trizodia sp. TS-e1964]
MAGVEKFVNRSSQKLPPPQSRGPIDPSDLNLRRRVAANTTVTVPRTLLLNAPATKSSDPPAGDLSPTPQGPRRHENPLSNNAYFASTPHSDGFSTDVDDEFDRTISERTFQSEEFLKNQYPGQLDQNNQHNGPVTWGLNYGQHRPQGHRTDSAGLMNDLDDLSPMDGQGSQTDKSEERELSSEGWDENPHFEGHGIKTAGDKLSGNMLAHNHSHNQTELQVRHKSTSQLTRIPKPDIWSLSPDADDSRGMLDGLRPPSTVRPGNPQIFQGGLAESNNMRDTYASLGPAKRGQQNRETHTLTREPRISIQPKTEPLSVDANPSNNQGGQMWSSHPAASPLEPSSPAPSRNSHASSPPSAEHSLENLADIPFNGDFQAEDMDEIRQGEQLRLPPPYDTGTLESKLAFISTQEQNSSLQRAFFGSLTAEEWEQSGDWFLERFADIVLKMKESRKKKRLIVASFEEEVDQREKTVLAARESLEGVMDNMKRGGQGVLRIG